MIQNDVDSSDAYSFKIRGDNWSGPGDLWMFRFFKRFSTVESNYSIAIATLSDWLKNLAPVFQPMRRETKTNCDMHTPIFPRFEQATCNYKAYRALCATYDWLE